MTDRELMQMALDVLEKLNKEGWILADFEDEVYASIEALRTRLDGWERVNMHNHKEGDLGIGAKPYAAQAAMVDQQTQGRMRVDPVTGDVGIGTVKWDASAPLVVHPHPAFQTTEPQREWIGLTDEEIDACVHENMTISDSRLRDAVYGVVLSTEAKLKEKNNA